MAELRGETTEFMAWGPVAEERLRQEMAALTRLQAVARRMQRILFLLRTSGSLEHTWTRIVELVQDAVEEDRRDGRRRSRGTIPGQGWPGL